MAVEERQDDAEAARDDLFQLHGAMVWSFALRMCIDPALAREVAREAFEVPAGGSEDSTCAVLAAASRAAALLAPEPAAAGRGLMGYAGLQERVRDCNTRLPTRQREVLALRALAGLSYGEMAAIMDINEAGVAQLISRARLALAEDLRGTPLVERAIARPECARAVTMMTMRIDGQLREAADRAWLDQHLAGCEACAGTRRALQEADLSYRAWLPTPAPGNVQVPVRFERARYVQPARPAARGGRRRRRATSLALLCLVIGALGAFAVTLFGSSRISYEPPSVRPSVAGSVLPTPEPYEPAGTESEPEFR